MRSAADLAVLAGNLNPSTLEAFPEQLFKPLQALPLQAAPSLPGGPASGKGQPFCPPLLSSEQLWCLHLSSAQRS